MALDADVLIRAGGGLAFMAAGVVALLGPPARGRFPLGFACLSFGAIFVAGNLIGFSTNFVNVGFTLAAAFGALFVIFIVWFALVGPWRIDQTGLLESNIGLAAATFLWIASAFLAAGDVPAQRPYFGLPENQLSDKVLLLYVMTALAASSFVALVGVLAARRAAREQDEKRIRGLAFLALGVSAFYSYVVGNYSSSIFPVTPIFHAIVLAATLCIPVAWLWLGPRRRIAWLPTWGTLVAILVGQSEYPLFGTFNTGIPGILRSVGAILVILALRNGVLGQATRTNATLNKKTLGAIALAILFIVAQIAQNFLSAEYGLLTGGVVAGVVLFAVNPIQRAVERMSERGGKRRPSSTGGGKNEVAVFRDAVQLALRDRMLTRVEQSALLRLSETLGIPVSRAMALIEDEERKAGVAA